MLTASGYGLHSDVEQDILAVLMGQDPHEHFPGMEVRIPCQQSVLFPALRLKRRPSRK
jgi:hypothetical protein